MINASLQQPHQSNQKQCHGTKNKRKPSIFLHLTAESPFSLHSSLETSVPSTTLTTRLRHSFLPLTLFLCQVNISSKSVGICLAHIYC